jgi:hypothetical protein
MQDQISPQFAMTVFWVGLGGIASVFAAIASIWANLKRKPTLEQEVYKDFVRCGELKALDDRHVSATSELFKQIREVRTDISKQGIMFEKSLTGLAEKIGELKGELHGHIKSEGNGK